MEKWLSIDFGERRIGFAIALKETGLAFPRPFLDTKVVDKVIPHILAFCKDERITNILVGVHTAQMANLAKISLLKNSFKNLQILLFCLFLLGMRPFLQ
jgi:RNase H-fold protein (predicted Holliday junction resolvase)